MPVGFDLDAAQTVAADDHVQRHQVLDEVTLLIDKSLVVAENTSGRTRYRLLETVRQYALEKLGESGDADAVRNRHRDHYTGLAALLDQPSSAGHRQHVEQAEIEIDNLRTAFTWSRDNSDGEPALQLASHCSRYGSPAAASRKACLGSTQCSPTHTPPPDVTPTTHARALAVGSSLSHLTDMRGFSEKEEEEEEEEEFLLMYGPKKVRKAIEERRKAREQAKKQSN